MNSLSFVNAFVIFFEFFYIFENSMFEKKTRGYNRETANSIIRKILECDMEFHYANTSEIHKVLLIFWNFKTKLSTTFQKNEKIQMNSEKSMNSF